MHYFPRGSTKANGAPGIYLRPTTRVAPFHCPVEIWRWLVSLSLVIMPRRKRPNPQSEENIRRIDTKSRAKKQTHGFQVHFLRGDRVVTKMFSDNVFGGKQAARRAARKFKQSMLRRLPRRKFLGG